MGGLASWVSAWLLSRSKWFHQLRCYHHYQLLLFLIVAHSAEGSAEDRHVADVRNLVGCSTDISTDQAGRNERFAREQLNRSIDSALNDARDGKSLHNYSVGIIELAEFWANFQPDSTATEYHRNELKAVAVFTELDREGSLLLRHHNRELTTHDHTGCSA